MSDRVYYCFCGDNCKFETMTKEQILAAIAQAAETGLVFDADAAFITQVKELNGGNGITFWAGTQAQYNALESIDANCFYIITDSLTYAEIPQTLKNHIENKDNPHGVTPAQIGAAPAGYVGNVYKPTTDEEIQTAIETVYASLANNKIGYAVLNIDVSGLTLPSALWFVTVFRGTATAGRVEACTYKNSSVVCKTLSGGTWDEWEWVNPPMVLGTEYRTTERWQSRPVYVKAVDFGALPASGYKNLNLLASTYDIIDWRVNLISDTGANHTIPWLASGTFEGQVRAAILGNDNRTIQISTNADMSAYTATVVIKYVKE